VKPRRSYFLPARVVMLVFRGKLLDALKHALERGELRVPADLTELGGLAGVGGAK
jgi:hypothetical protein